MKDARSLLDSLMQGGGELGARAKQAWDGQSTGTKGALAGGLLGVLLGGGRGGLGSVIRVGGAALIGSLASRAYADWQSGKSALPGADDGDGEPDRRFLPDDSAAVDDLSARLLRAMVAAARADGRVTDEERAQITAQLAQMGIGDEARAMIEEEMAAPLDVGRIAGLARTAEEAAEIYAASLLAANPEGAAEKGYLAMLAARLGLDPKLVEHLHARTAGLA
jgi:uncharacterized membrane protein YebE (DUF533 family)